MYSLIINPVAGNGRAKEVSKLILKVLKEKGILCESFFTSHPGHEEELAKDRETVLDTLLTIPVESTLSLNHERAFMESFIPLRSTPTPLTAGFCC